MWARAGVTSERCTKKTRLDIKGRAQRKRRSRRSEKVARDEGGKRVRGGEKGRHSLAAGGQAAEGRKIAGKELSFLIRKRSRDGGGGRKSNRTKKKGAKGLTNRSGPGEISPQTEKDKSDVHIFRMEKT